jgi:hypothetical protein
MLRLTCPISWIKAAQKDFQKFPEAARIEIVSALTIAAEGGKADYRETPSRLGFWSNGDCFTV